MKNTLRCWTLGFASLLFLNQPSAQAAKTPPSLGGPVLIIQAHPDDETMIGGILGYLEERKIPVYSVCITRGDGGRTNHVNGDASQLIKMRPVELQKAAKLYGIREALQLEEPDAAFRDPKTGLPTREVQTFLDGKVWNLERIKSSIEGVAKRVNPEVVLTFLPKHEAIHGHHQAAGAIALQLHQEMRLGSRVQAIYGAHETNWYPAGTFSSRSDEVRFPLAVESKALGMSFAQFQERGARAHATQDTGRRGLLPADEVLVPLFEKNPGSSLIRQLARSHSMAAQ
jgi:LmbE family N-acetylglucosaminyl deacetylase